MSKAKSKITDADIIDVIIKDRMDRDKAERERNAARLEVLKKTYKDMLLALVMQTKRGKALMAVYPGAVAERLYHYKGAHISVRFNKTHPKMANEEMSADIAITPRAAKRVEKLHASIEELQTKVRENQGRDRIAWKREILRDVLKAQPKALADFRICLVKAVLGAYKVLPEHRHHRLERLTGISQPTKVKAARKK